MTTEISNLSHRIINGMEYASTIQLGLLPKDRHFASACKDFFIYYKPQDIIGGDFYWLTKKGDTIYFAMADCSGHGVSGALLSVLGISLLNYVTTKDFKEVGLFLNEVDKKWIETFTDETVENKFDNDWMEITICSYQPSTRILQYSCAGGEFIIINDTTTEVLKGNRYPIGGWQLEKNRAFETHSILLKENSTLYFYSDGLKHQYDNNNQRKFSRTRIINFFQSVRSLGLDDQKELFEDAFNNWKGENNCTDDVSLVAIQF